jgi:autotransporter-associated beta strand protein
MTGLPQGGLVVIGGTSTATFSGALTAGSNVDFVFNRVPGAAGFALSSPAGSNTWGNTFIESGSLVLGTHDGMPASTLMTLGKAGATGTATYQMNGRSQTVAGLTSTGAGGVLKVTNTAGSVSTITINTPAGASHTYGTAAGGPAATMEGNLKVTKTGAGTQTLTGANTYVGLTTVAGGTLVLTKDAFTPAALTGVGAADVTGGRLVFDYRDGGANPVAEVAAALKGSHDASPAWSAGAIKSSTADAIHGLGYLDDGGMVTVAYTYVGDLNLDGKVNGDDYVLIDRGAAMGLNGWVNGDVNYDGVVTVADYFAMDTVFGTVGVAHEVAGLFAQREAQFGEGYVAALTAAVPEPGLMGVVGMAVLAVGGRRRRGRGR